MKLFLLSFIFFGITLFGLHSLFGTHSISEFEHEHTNIMITPPITAENSKKPLQSAAEDTEKEMMNLEKKRIIFSFKPKNFEEIAEKPFKRPIMQTVESSIFGPMIEDIVIILYEEEKEVRGNMKDKILRLYNPDRIGEKETVAVFLHELAHYIDLYYLKEGEEYDLSHEFYTISWVNTKISRPGQSEADFVSGYASTNAYEDFSESFIYFVLHNTHFKQKAQTSEALMKKYNFLANIIFPTDEFKGTSFSEGNFKNYQRDVTKLDFSLENFLDYLKKSI